MFVIVLWNASFFFFKQIYFMFQRKKEKTGSVDVNETAFLGDLSL